MWTSPMFDMMESAKADANQNKGDVHMSLGNVIRKYRKIKNLTQEEMAGRLGVTAPAVNKWENENSYPDITLLAPIARLLGISLDTLLSFREELTAEEITGMIREADHIFQSKIRNGKGNRHRFMLKRIGWRKHIKHMRNFYFQIFKEPVWSCMECICLQYRTMTKKERICW